MFSFFDHSKSPSQSLLICKFPNLQKMYIRKDDVLRLDVSVCDALFMQAVHCLADHFDFDWNFFFC